MAKNPVKVDATNLKQVNDLLAEQANKYREIGAVEEAIFLKHKMEENNRKVINDLLAEQVRLVNDTSLSEATRNAELRKIEKTITEITAEQGKLNKQLKIENELLKSSLTWRQLGVNVAKEMGNQLKIGWTYLQASDKVIKSTILNLGLSGAKASAMRLSFEQSVSAVSLLGGNLEDIQKIMEGFADETGRARALSAQMIEDITAIGKGTGLGVEQATRLAGQFEYMGLNAKSSMDFVQGVVDTSERMGVNTTKVLKNVTDNFKKLSTYTFQGGVKAMGQMAMSAEKTKVEMTTALNVAEATRSLDKVIELGANLQVMGGEFAKMDPFQWLYIARNEPDKMTEKISEMTKGIYTLRKNSDGTFEKFISPEDRDRLSNVAKTLGIAEEEMFKIAQRRLDLTMLDKQTAGLGLNKREKELIQGAATMNTATGKYQVLLGGTMRDISTLTKEQANAFASEQVLLKERAKEAQTFDEAFKNTVNALKGALLPFLKTINSVLSNVRAVTDPIVGKFGMWGAAGLLLSAGIVWKGLISGLSILANNLANKLPILSKLIPFIGKSGGGTEGGIGRGGGAAGGKWWQTKAGTIRKGAPEMMKARGMSNLATGAGVGAAGLGIGAGIGAAALGISELAKSIKDVDIEKLNLMNKTLIGLGVGMAVIGGLGMLAGPGLLAVGGGIALIGAGIGIAAAGIGVMAEGLSLLVDKSKGAGKDFLMVAGGIAAIAGSMALFSNPLSGIGILAFAGVMATIVGASLATAHVAESIERMGTAMKGSKDDWIAVQNAITAISGANTKGGGMLAELATLLKSPLKVEFADKNVGLVNDITLNIDGEKFMQKVINVNTLIQKTNYSKEGREASKPAT
jgi:hypothetical protein